VYVIRDGNTAGGTRELQSPSRNCVDLAATVALAISIAVDPDVLERVEALPAVEPGDGQTVPPPVQTQPEIVERVADAPPPQRPSAATTRNSACLENAATWGRCIVKP
jgi:hypothetical protein